MIHNNNCWWPSRDPYFIVYLHYGWEYFYFYIQENEDNILTVRLMQGLLLIPQQIMNIILLEYLFKI